ncbi:MAG: hypothetical protein O7B99_13395, partial [Planctomycetota bacterium]|nr:hypothetical protein [Planctomycetota bacterium]
MPPHAPLVLSFVTSLALVSAGQEPYSPHVEPASDEGARAMAKIEIPEGFAIGLWAAEPMLANPVAFTVDGGGDVYVAESF